MTRAALLFVLLTSVGCASKQPASTTSPVPEPTPASEPAPAPAAPAVVLYCVRAAEDPSIGICERDQAACQQIADGVAASGTAVTACEPVSMAWCSNMRSLSDGSRVETCYPTPESCEIGLQDYQQNYTDRYDDMRACAPWNGQ